MHTNYRKLMADIYKRSIQSISNIFQRCPLIQPRVTHHHVHLCAVRIVRILFGIQRLCWRSSVDECQRQARSRRGRTARIDGGPYLPVPFLILITRYMSVEEICNIECRHQFDIYLKQTTRLLSLYYMHSIIFYQ